MEDPTKTTATETPRDERVGELAFMIWEQEGRPEGKQDEHWFMACEIVDAQDQGVELKDLPPWLTRAEATPAKPAETRSSDKVVHHPRHKSAA